MCSVYCQMPVMIQKPLILVQLYLGFTAISALTNGHIGFFQAKNQNLLDCSLFCFSFYTVLQLYYTTYLINVLVYTLH